MKIYCLSIPYAQLAYVARVFLIINDQFHYQGAEIQEILWSHAHSFTEVYGDNIFPLDISSLTLKCNGQSRTGLTE